MGLASSSRPTRCRANSRNGVRAKRNGLNLRHSDGWEGVMGQTAFLASEVRLEVLEEAFPEKKIETILREMKRQSVRVRKLPATMMVYYIIALGLFVSVGCREVLR